MIETIKATVSDTSLLNKAYITLSADDRISVWHISIYTAFLYLWNKNGFINPIRVTRKQIMQLAHVHSIVTYHKCISQLAKFGYIRYQPNYNSYCGSRIYIVLR